MKTAFFAAMAIGMLLVAAVEGRASTDPTISLNPPAICAPDAVDAACLMVAK